MNLSYSGLVKNVEYSSPRESIASLQSLGFLSFGSGLIDLLFIMSIQLFDLLKIDFIALGPNLWVRINTEDTPKSKKIKVKNIIVIVTARLFFLLLLGMLFIICFGNYYSIMVDNVISVKFFWSVFLFKIYNTNQLVINSITKNQIGSFWVFGCSYQGLNKKVTVDN